MSLSYTKMNCFYVFLNQTLRLLRIGCVHFQYSKTSASKITNVCFTKNFWFKVEKSSQLSFEKMKLTAYEILSKTGEIANTDFRAGYGNGKITCGACTWLQFTHTYCSQYLCYFYKSLPSVKIINDKIIENTAIKGQKETSYDSKWITFNLTSRLW